MFSMLTNLLLLLLLLLFIRTYLRLFWRAAKTASFFAHELAVTGGGGGYFDEFFALFTTGCFSFCSKYTTPCFEAAVA
jgi:hypothetical protein